MTKVFDTPSLAIAYSALKVATSHGFKDLRCFLTTSPSSVSFVFEMPDEVSAQAACDFLKAFEAGWIASNEPKAE